jgi:hypothetical protein
MSHKGPPSLERVLWTLVIAIIGLELLVGVLPRIIAPVIVLAVVAVIVRLVWWYTRL